MLDKLDDEKYSMGSSKHNFRPRNTIYLDQDKGRGCTAETQAYGAHLTGAGSQEAC